MKIYTKTGDKGETSLFDGTRVMKSDLRVEVYGTIDELNSYVGSICAFDIPKEEKEFFLWISEKLFSMGSELAISKEDNLPKGIKKICNLEVEVIEKKIDELSAKLPELKNFIIPGGCFESGFVHIARTVCRRAERRIVELSRSESINPYVLIFLNRLSDFLFVFARYLNSLKGVEEIIWKRS
ncbi:MAG: cob(I)yrinic acid a,c-diamide adenosyltransferase [Candidatus Kapaibacteriota bacterium]